MQNFTFKTAFSGIVLSALLATNVSAAVVQDTEIEVGTISSARPVIGTVIDKMTGKPIMRKNVSRHKSAITEIPQSETIAPKSDDAATIVFEDFNKWTEGTEHAPAGEPLDNDWIIPDEYMLQPGWTGLDVYQAGGTCGLAAPGWGGCINTPKGDYSGHLTVTFRAKGLYSDSGQMYVIVSNDKEQMLDYVSVQVPGDGWTDYEVEFDVSYGGTDAHIQFNTYDELVIDDIEVKQSRDFLADPALKPATNFTNDGFTANWGEVGGADQYLLSVYKQVPTSDVETMEVNYDFTGCTGELPDFLDMARPEGKEIEIYSGGNIDEALLMQNGDTLTILGTGGQLVSLTYHLQGVNIPDLLYGVEGTIYREGWDGYQWRNEGYIFMDFLDNNEVSHYDVSDDVAGNYFAYRLYVGELDEGISFVVDSIGIVTTAPVERVYEFEEKPVEGTSYTLTGLDPYADYYYTVVAYNSETGVRSNGPIECMDAFGVAAPAILEPTDIDPRGGYTANWEVTPKATSYMVSNFDVFTAPEPCADYVVLSDNFDNAEGIGYTTDAPYAFNNVSMESLDEFTDRKGWYGYLCGLADGAIGSIGIPEFGIGGQLQSPELTLSNNGGTFHVKVEACSQYDGEYLEVFTASGLTGILCPLTTEYQTFKATSRVERSTRYLYSSRHILLHSSSTASK